MQVETQIRILEAGKQEFLNRGFADASLRTIAAKANVTTGAIYGYFPDKTALFCSIVEPAAKAFKEEFLSAQKSFVQLPEAEQIASMSTYSTSALQKLIDYIYENFDTFRLIVCCSAGTEYAHYIESLADLETQYTLDFIEVLRRNRQNTLSYSENLVHILCRAYFSTIFETVAHNMDKSEADRYIADITAFFKAGWDKILRL